MQDVIHNHLHEFKNEIYTLSQIEHRNLVRLYGYLEHGDEKIIVVEYVGNGNLREHLDGKSWFVSLSCEKVNYFDFIHS